MGAKFDGEKAGGLKNGYGREVLKVKVHDIAIELKYVGFYKNDKKHGRGLLIYKNWEINGYWENDLLIGYCSYEEKPSKAHLGLSYCGTMLQNSDTSTFPWMKDGFGMYSIEMNDQSTSVSTGFFKNEKKLVSCNINRFKRNDIKFEMLKIDDTKEEKDAKHKKGIEDKLDSCIASYNPDSLLWELKSYVDGIENKIECINEPQNALSSLFQDNPIKQLFKGKSDVKETNKVIDRLNEMINNKFSFVDKFEAGGRRFKILEIIGYNEGIYHFVIAEESLMDTKYHAKCYLCRGKGNVQLCAWAERIKKCKAMNGVISGEVMTPQCYGSYIMALQSSMDSLAKISPLQLIEVGPNNESLDAKFFMEVEEYLDPSGFLNELYKKPDFTLDMLEIIYVLLLQKLAFMEEHGIYYGNLNPEHVWVANYNDPNKINIKLVGLSHSVLLDRNGVTYDRNTYLKSGEDILKFDATVLTEHKWDEKEIRAALAKANVMLYIFDIKKKSSKYYIYLPFETKQKIKQQQKEEHLLEESKVPLFLKESTAYSMSFFTSLMDFVIKHANDHKDYTTDSLKMMLQLIEVTRKKASISQDSETLAKGKKEFLVYILKMAQQISEVKLVKSNDTIKNLIIACQALICQESIADIKGKQNKIEASGNDNPTIYLTTMIKNLKSKDEPFTSFSSVRTFLSNTYPYINM